MFKLEFELVHKVTIYHRSTGRLSPLASRSALEELFGGHYAKQCSIPGVAGIVLHGSTVSCSVNIASPILL